MGSTQTSQPSSSTLPIPTLKFTNTTPSKQSELYPDSSDLFGPSRHIPRLLYRGALSLPDSHLLLDGLTFTIDLPVDEQHANLKLLENPLPLALESMRGRPCLSFVGVEIMNSLHCDFSGGVSLHVHPSSILTRQLFANHLCAEPVTSPSCRSELGIRIRLGDAGSSDIVVYGRVHPSSSIMKLCVARVLPSPPAASLAPVAKLRAPRPDDPTPRRPPLFFGARGVQRNGKAKDDSEDPPTKKKPRKDKEPATRPATTKPKAKKSGAAPSSSTAIFKLPLPPPPCGLPKDDTSARGGENEHETANKLIVKKATVRLLSHAGISKQHPEFKDLFGFVYRGVCFALRSKMEAPPWEGFNERVDQIIQAHIKLYVTDDEPGVDQQRRK